MLKQIPSARKLTRLNRRQRKKLRVGEFQELVFKISIRFGQPMEGSRLDAFVDEFIDLVESRRLVVGGLGGRLPLLETTGVVSTWNRGSTTEEDRRTVLDWLLSHPEVTYAKAGALIDGWYGWEDTDEFRRTGSLPRRNQRIRNADKSLKVRMPPLQQAKT